jgi:Tol biopolymer transport system component
MKWVNGYKMSLMLFVFVVAIVLGSGEPSNADFTFGTPTNLGSVVNTSARDEEPCISLDGLSLYCCSLRPGGYGKYDLWITSRVTTEDDWGPPVNLGPTVNSSSADFTPKVSADGLMLYFVSDRPGGYGSYDLWVTRRTTKQDDWGTPVNLGPTVNKSGMDACMAISDDGLELYFWSDRPGGYGSSDIWVTRRATIEETWSMPVNLGPTVNSSATELCSDISGDGLLLFFVSKRSGGYGGNYGDIWITRRATISDSWGPPVNLGPTLNTSASETGPALSADGSTLYFGSDRPGGSGGWDIWQASIDPVVDLNGDGIVDATDMCIIVDHWGTDNPLCDIGPTPFGDGVVDVQDLIVLAEHLFEEFPPVE